MLSLEDHETFKTATYRKICLRLLPFILLLYFICYIDRVNIGFAKLQFLKDLGLTDANFGVAAGLFYVTYGLFDLPSNLMLSRIGVRKTILRIMVLWGIVSGAQMFIHTAPELYILRLLFGAAEAGFLPGVMLYLTFWFPGQYRARIMALFYAGVPMSAIIGSPLSGLVMQHMNDVLGLRAWQWLFLIFAIPAVVLGIVSYFYLDENPKAAKWLTSMEKQLVIDELDAESKARATRSQNTFIDLLRDPRLYAIALLNFASNVASNTATFWMPSLLKNVGIKSYTHIGYISGGISVLAMIGMLLIAYSSDRQSERRWHFALCAIFTAAAYVCLPLVKNNVYISVALMAITAIGGISLLTVYWTISTSYLSGKGGAAGGIGFVSMIGAAGSAVSPAIIGWLKQASGSLYVGLMSTTVIIVIGAVIVLAAIPKEISLERRALELT